MKRLTPPAFLLIITGLLVLSTADARLQQPAAADRFEVSDVMVPMRDGKKLHTKIFTPRLRQGAAGSDNEPLPIIFKRTPYGIEGSANNFNAYFKALADEGYIFVFQDIRGKFGSEGDFVMQRPARTRQGSGAAGYVTDPSSIDEGTDTYDTIDWLVKNVRNNNGRVGMLGVSYDGWTTIMAAIEPHPALKAISPQASPADMWLGDDFHHNGAFRLSYGFEYAAMMESGKDVQQFSFDRYDTFDWYLSLGPLSNVNSKYLHGKIPTWNDYVAHPDYDDFWKRQTMVPHLTSVKVPTLNVAGWWDQEDFYGPVRIYDELEKHDTQGINYLVVGPWRHGGWSGGTGDSLGAIPFGSNTAEYFRDKVQAPFFAYYLKDKGAKDFAQALTFEAGANEWRRWDQWPPTKQTDVRALLLGAHEQLTLGDQGSGTGDQGFDEVRVRSCAPRAVSSAADSGDLFSWRIEVVDVAGRRSAFRGRSRRCAQLRDADARCRCHDRRRRGRACLRIDHGQRRGLDREVDRRLSREQPAELVAGRLPADGIERSVSRPLSDRIRNAKADRAEQGARVQLEPAHAELHLQEGAPHHGAGAEHVVSDHRPESSDVREEYLRGEGQRLQGRDAPGLSGRGLRFACGRAGRSRAMSWRSLRSSPIIISGCAALSRMLNISPASVRA